MWFSESKSRTTVFSAHRAVMNGFKINKTCKQEHHFSVCANELQRADELTLWTPRLCSDALRYMVTVRFHASLQSGSLFRNEPPIIPLSHRWLAPREPGLLHGGLALTRISPPAPVSLVIHKSGARHRPEPTERATAEAHRTAPSRWSSEVGESSSAHGRPDKQVAEQIYGSERGSSAAECPDTRRIPSAAEAKSHRQIFRETERDGERSNELREPGVFAPGSATRTRTHTLKRAPIHTNTTRLQTSRTQGWSAVVCSICSFFFFLMKVSFVFSGPVAAVLLVPVFAEN